MSSGMVSYRKYVIIIAGPTAIGKSQLAMRLALDYNTSILSADARQCFREMNIGTAKPGREELLRVKHYFIDSHSIHDEISGGKYEQLAIQYLEEIFAEKNIAIVCGGTGLYIRALIHGMDDMPDTDKDIEDGVEALYREKGIDWLQKSLQAEDPLYFNTSDLQNPARMMRALSFVRSNGESILNYRIGNTKERDFEIIGIGLEMDRNLLYERIDRRVDKMVEEGLIDEVKRLYPFRHLKNMLTVGYSEFYKEPAFPGDQKEIGLAIEKVKQHTRNYAKRQMTWFKNKEDLTWFGADEYEQIKHFIDQKIAAANSNST